MSLLSSHAFGMSCCTVVVDKHTSSTRHVKGIWFWQLQGLNTTTAMPDAFIGGFPAWSVVWSMVTSLDSWPVLVEESWPQIMTFLQVPCMNPPKKTSWKAGRKPTSFSPLSSFCCWESLDWQVPIIPVGSCLDHTAILPKLFRLSRTAQRQARFEWTPEMLASTKSSGNA